MLTLKSKNTGFFTSLRCLYSVKCAVNGIRLSQFLRSSAKRRKLKTRIAKKEKNKKGCTTRLFFNLTEEKFMQIILLINHPNHGLVSLKACNQSEAVGRKNARSFSNNLR